MIVLSAIVYTVFTYVFVVAVIGLITNGGFSDE
jgi:hypothetical protein